MIKKFAYIFIIGLVVASFTVISYAGDSEKQEFKVINPTEEVVVDEKLVTSFMAPEDTKVTIEVYHEKDNEINLEDENYIKKYIEKEEKIDKEEKVDKEENELKAKGDKEKFYLANESLEVTVGAFERGWKEIRLKQGLNIIYFTAEHKDGNKEVVKKQVTLKDIDKAKQKLQNILNLSTTDVLNGLINSINLEKDLKEELKEDFEEDLDEDFEGEFD